MEATAIRQFALPGATPPVARAARVDHWQQTSALAMLVLLAYLPYAEFLHDQLGLTVFGYGAEVTIIPTAVILLLFTITGVFRMLSFLIYPLLIIVAGGVIVALRYYMRFDASAVDSLQQAVAMRYMILMPVYIL